MNVNARGLSRWIQLVSFSTPPGVEVGACAAAGFAYPSRAAHLARRLKLARKNRSASQAYIENPVKSMLPSMSVSRALPGISCRAGCRL